VREPYRRAITRSGSSRIWAGDPRARQRDQLSAVDRQRPPFEMSWRGYVERGVPVAAACWRRRELLIENVGVNPRAPGTWLYCSAWRANRSRQLAGRSGEPVADLIARPASLIATQVAARRSDAVTRSRSSPCSRAARVARPCFGSGELRVKESNRSSCRGQPARARCPRRGRGNDLQSRERIAPRAVSRRLPITARMAFACLAQCLGGREAVGEAVVAISYPGSSRT